MDQETLLNILTVQTQRIDAQDAKIELLVGENQKLWAKLTELSELCAHMSEIMRAMANAMTK